MRTDTERATDIANSLYLAGYLYLGFQGREKPLSGAIEIIRRDIASLPDVIVDEDIKGGSSDGI